MPSYRGAAETSSYRRSSFVWIEATAFDARSCSRVASSRLRCATSSVFCARASSWCSSFSRARRFSSRRSRCEVPAADRLPDSGRTARPSKAANPEASCSSRSTPRTSAFRASSSATEALRSSFTRRRVASLAGFPRESRATATSARRPRARSRSSVAFRYASGLPESCVVRTRSAASAASRAACGRSRAARFTARTTPDGFRSAATAFACSGRPAPRSS